MQVLAHRIVALSRVIFIHQIFRSLLRCPLVVLCLVCHQIAIHHAVYGQILVKGQIFTNGLAIVDAPAPNTIVHAGSAINLAIDVSGNGQLSQPLAATGLDSLAVFLVSSQTNANMTVSTGPGYLTQEPGSTVKHLNWPIPTCLSPGQYNLTIYEMFHLDGASFFGITPIPLAVENTSQQGSCISNNALDVQPQPFSSFTQNPWLTQSAFVSMANVPSQSGSVLPSLSSTPAVAEVNTITVTLGPSGIQWPLTIVQPSLLETFVLQPVPSGLSGVVTVVSVTVPTPTTTDDADDAQGTVTVMISPTSTPTPVPVVLVSVGIVFGTAAAPGGSSTTFTTTSTSFITTTAIMGMPTGSSNDAGFLPINAVSSAASLTVSMFYVFPMFVVGFHFW